MDTHQTGKIIDYVYVSYTTNTEQYCDKVESSSLLTLQAEIKILM